MLQKDSSGASTEWQQRSLSLFVRMSPTHESLGAFHKILRPSLLMFWPWREVELVAMLEEPASMADDARGKFEEARRLLTQQPPFVRLKFPVNEDDPSIFAAPRTRQLYAYFFADRYTTTEYVGLVDTDTLFTTPVTPRSLFDEQARPKVIAFVGSPSDLEHWGQVPNRTLHFLKLPHVVRSMSYFPLVIKARHLQALRRHVEQMHGRCLELVFRDFCAITPRCCSHCVIGNFIWHFHRDEYHWSFQQLNPHWNPTSIFGQTDDWSFLTRENTHPMVRVAVHVGGGGAYHFNVVKPDQEGMAWSDEGFPPFDGGLADVCIVKQMLWGFCLALIWHTRKDKDTRSPGSVPDFRFDAGISGRRRSAVCGTRL